MNRMVCYLLLMGLAVACNTEPQKETVEQKIGVLLSQAGPLGLTDSGQRTIHLFTVPLP